MFVNRRPLETANERQTERRPIHSIVVSVLRTMNLRNGTTASPSANIGSMLSPLGAPFGPSTILNQPLKPCFCNNFATFALFEECMYLS